MNDLISRQAAIDAIGEIHSLDYNAQAIKARIEQLPSAQPERKVGKWVGTEFDGYADGYPVYYEWKCSVCGCIFEDDEPTYRYCPNCGAKMESE